MSNKDLSQSGESSPVLVENMDSSFENCIEDKSDDFAENARKCSPPLTTAHRSQIDDVNQDVTTNGRPSTVFCRCCLLDFSESEDDDPFLNMQNEAFSFRNQQISFVDGYLDVNNDSIEEFPGVPISEVKICSLCVAQMESAYFFKKLCYEASVILRRRYPSKKLSDQIDSQLVKIDTNWGEADRSSRTLVTDNDSVDNTVVVKRTHCVAFHKKSKKQTKSFTGIKNQKNFVEVRHLRSSQKYSAKDINNSIVSKPNKDERNCNKAVMPSCSDQMDNLQDNRDDRVVNNKISRVPLRKNKLFAQANKDNKKRLKEVHPRSGRYACTVCLKDYASKKSLKNHNDAKHLNKVHPCKHCGKEFHGRSTLFHHIRSNHLKIRHKCGKCSKTFTQSHNLRSHKKSKHLHIRYICDICSNVFKSRYGILLHMQSNHLNIYYSCKICDKKYRDLPPLWSHSFTHRGFMPFQCTACNYTSSWRTAFMQHLKINHGIKYDSKIHGYKKETFAKVLSFVR